MTNEPRDRATILFAVESMERAGAEQVVLSLISGLDRSRFRPVVCCLTERGELAEAVEDLEVPVVALHKHPHFDLPVIPKLTRVLREHRVDIVHSHVWPANVWGRVVGRANRVPHLVVTEHNVDLWKRWPHFLVDRALARITDRIACVSRAVQAFYRDTVGIPERKLEYLPNGIDTSLYAAPGNGLGESRAGLALGLGSDHHVVTIVARLLPQKNHHCLLQAVALWRAKDPLARCLVVGDGALREELEERARSLGVRDVVLFLGERRDVPRILAASDVVTLSSVHEGMPLAVLEGMAAGKPAVVTDVGGNREVVEDGRTGLVVPPEDPEALADAYEKLFSDTAVRARMGAQGRDRVNETFSLTAMVRRNEALYATLLSSRSDR